MAYNFAERNGLNETKATMQNLRTQAYVKNGWDLHPGDSEVKALANYCVLDATAKPVPDDCALAAIHRVQAD